jgi:hypothetical protein
MMNGEKRKMFQKNYLKRYKMKEKERKKLYLTYIGDKKCLKIHCCICSELNTLAGLLNY